jgi:phosphatidylglycerophosphatase A
MGVTTKQHTAWPLGRVARTPTLVIASGGGIGLLPFMPGTFGTLAGLPVSLAINSLASSSFALGATALAALVLIAIIAADQACRLLEAKDPSCIVIDEIAGFALANFLTETSAAMVVAFLLFRLFDIAKVFPGRRLESLPGGAGIVLDDILAGVYTVMVVRLLSWAGVL